MIESELFGHCKGAFTGAVADRQGWLEVCGEPGTVFLDEIGELEHSIQVKLLRVLQTQQFSRVGETKSRSFEGKFIAATNRELELEIQGGRFREDLYYRLCADQIQTPTLREQLPASSTTRNSKVLAAKPVLTRVGDLCYVLRWFHGVSCRKQAKYKCPMSESTRIRQASMTCLP